MKEVARKERCEEGRYEFLLQCRLALEVPPHCGENKEVDDSDECANVRELDDSHEGGLGEKCGGWRVKGPRSLSVVCLSWIEYIAPCGNGTELTDFGSL